MRLKQIFYSFADKVLFPDGVERRILTESFKFRAQWSRYYESDYEPETFKFFRENLKGGDTVMDIGAHIGLFTVLTSRLVGNGGKVFAFEPTPFTRNVLTEVVRLNGCEANVEIRPEAVAAEKGTVFFFDTGTEISNANSLVRTARSKAEIEVPVTSVDEFVLERALTVNCLKIDVEGAEYDLLKGARRTLVEQRPVGRLGLHPESIIANKQSLEMIWDILEDYGYHVEFEGETISRSAFCSKPTLFDVNLFPKI